jgi:hypothetical protein
MRSGRSTAVARSGKCAGDAGEGRADHDEVGNVAMAARRLMQRRLRLAGERWRSGR